MEANYYSDHYGKATESYMGFQSRDTYSGGQLVPNYEDYKSADCSKHCCIPDKFDPFSQTVPLSVYNVAPTEIDEMPQSYDSVRNFKVIAQHNCGHSEYHSSCHYCAQIDFDFLQQRKLEKVKLLQELSRSSQWQPNHQNVHGLRNQDDVHVNCNRNKIYRNTRVPASDCYGVSDTRSNGISSMLRERYSRKTRDIGVQVGSSDGFCKNFNERKSFSTECKPSWRSKTLPTDLDGNNKENVRHTKIVYDNKRSIPAHHGGRTMTKYDRTNCRYCRTAKLEYDHPMLNENGDVVCEVLRKYKCPFCGATGSQAHTLKYCPKNPITNGDLHRIKALGKGRAPDCHRDEAFRQRLCLANHTREMAKAMQSFIRLTRLKKPKLRCSYCVRLGLPYEHKLKDFEGRIECPVLSAETCEECGETGASAHTIYHCEVRKQKERLLETPVGSSHSTCNRIQINSLLNRENITDQCNCEDSVRAQKKRAMLDINLKSCCDSVKYPATNTQPDGSKFCTFLSERKEGKLPGNGETAPETAGTITRLVSTEEGSLQSLPYNDECRKKILTQNGKLGCHTSKGNASESVNSEHLDFSDCGQSSAKEASASYAARTKESPESCASGKAESSSCPSGKESSAFSESSESGASAKESLTSCASGTEESSASCACRKEESSESCTSGTEESAESCASGKEESYKSASEDEVAIESATEVSAD